MNGSIFLLRDDDQLTEMREEGYASEDLLQSLLEQHPALLAGDQMSGGEAKRWLLVKREASVPGEEGGAGRWSLDHLFLDQDGIPTLVEVKRRGDTRIRREVVGQMLDYAANAVVYWPIEKLISEFETTCLQAKRDPVEVLAGHLGEDEDAESFWGDVKTNLEAGRVRLVFVADRIPLELQRIVEFLNGQMNPAEVLAVEVRQFAGQGLRTLVPRVVGQTAMAQQKKLAGRRGSGARWDEARFLEALRATGHIDEASVVAKVLEWARVKGLEVGWGKGADFGSFSLQRRAGATTYQFCYFWTHDVVGLPFGRLAKRPPFDAESLRLELRDRVLQLPGVDIPEEKLSRSSDFKISVLVDESNFEHFCENVIEWLVSEVDRYSGETPR